MSDEAPAFPVMYEFQGDGSTWHVGVPARDLTLEDWDALDADQQKLLQAEAQKTDGLYKQVQTVTNARTIHRDGPKMGEQKVKARKRASRKGEQADPDPQTPGRVDADVVSGGLAVPPTDEPIGEGASGFQQSDTGQSNPQEG